MSRIYIFRVILYKVPQIEFIFADVYLYEEHA